jgi:choline dehydrogenase
MPRASRLLETRKYLASCGEHQMQSSFDFIVCGAGSSGSVVAKRLSENARARVLLLEAGGTDEIESVQQVDQWFTNLGTERDWSYRSAPNAELVDRSLVYPSGKMLGGGSSLNAGFWARGHRSDWDSYAALAGDDAWSYRQVLDLYRRIEDWRGSTDLARRHHGGVIPIEAYRNQGVLADAVSATFESAGIPLFESFNGALCEAAAGFSGPERNVVDGIKYNTFHSYLRDFRTRANLTVLTGALVQSIVFEGKRAAGVDVILNGAIQRLHASQEVVLSTGAIQTPKILMLSGLGRETTLRRLGLPVRVSLPGVGENLQDHPLMRGINWTAREDQPFDPKTRFVACHNSKGEADAPDTHIIFLGVMYAGPETAKQYGYPAGNLLYTGGWGFSVALLRPQSRGRLLLLNIDPASKPVPDLRYFSDPADKETMLRSIEFCREMGHAKSLQPFRSREMSPVGTTRADLLTFLEHGSHTYFHPTSTAKMGRDEMSVVDANLKVYGVDGLRIADASILPHIPAANTMAPSIVIGERAGDILRQAHGL